MVLVTFCFQFSTFLLLFPILKQNNPQNTLKEKNSNDFQDLFYRLTPNEIQFITKTSFNNFQKTILKCKTVYRVYPMVNSIMFSETKVCPINNNTQF